MNKSADPSEADQDADTNQREIPWLRATPEDLVGLDFEAPLAGPSTADSNDLSDLFHAATQPTDDSTEFADTPKSRIFAMLAALTGMRFKPQDRNEPFGPMVIWPDGRRSAIVSDFRPSIEVLAAMAESSGNLVLRARLSDVSWLLDRKRGKLALAAIAAYTAIVHKVDSNELKCRFAAKDGALHENSRDYIRRALQISRSVGWDKPETAAARSLVVKLRERARALRALVPMYWFCDLDLDFSVSDPAEVAASLDEVLSNLPADAGSHIVVGLWRLAARAYHLAKKGDDKNRCLAEAAERLAAEAESKQASALLAAHFLSSAIAALHGIPGKKDRRTALRHRLVDFQARVPEEMSVFSQKLDLKEIVEKVREAVGHGGLLDKLFIFAGLATSP